MFKTIRREMGRVVGWSGPGLGEKYSKRREKVMEKKLRAAPSGPVEPLELEGLNIEEADHYVIRVPPISSGEVAGYYPCESMISLKAKIAELTSNGNTKLFVTAYKLIEEYKVSTKIVTVAEPFTST